LVGALSVVGPCIAVMGVVPAARNRVGGTTPITAMQGPTTDKAPTKHLTQTVLR